jgi:imidazole glycerol-phosphate synthase subunit HisF
MEVVTHNATKRTGVDPVAHAVNLQHLGVGEIVVNSVDLDGTMEGYNLDLAQSIRNVTTVPLTILGGAGTLGHIAELVTKFQVIGAAAGSLFVFKGKFRAVLINYPSQQERYCLL